MDDGGSKTKIAVFASGRGTNFDALADAIQNGSLAAEITSVVCDRPGAPVIEKARARGIKVHLVPPTDVSVPGGDIGLRRNRHEELILERLEGESVEWLVFAGYMRILGDRLLDRFRKPFGSAPEGRHSVVDPETGMVTKPERLTYTRIVNIHPSVLPAFPGKDSYAQAFHYGCAVAGVTVHLVEAEVDGGPIVAQETFSIAHLSSAEEVEAAGLLVEHRLYPQTLQWLFSGKFNLVSRSAGSSSSPQGRRLCVRSS